MRHWVPVGQMYLAFRLGSSRSLFELPLLCCMMDSQFWVSDGHLYRLYPGLWIDHGGHFCHVYRCCWRPSCHSACFRHHQKPISFQHFLPSLHFSPCSYLAHHRRSQHPISNLLTSQPLIQTLTSTSTFSLATSIVETSLPYHQTPSASSVLLISVTNYWRNWHQLLAAAPLVWLLVNLFVPFASI